MQKLIAYDHLEGDPGLEGGKNVPLFTDILNMICNCVDNSSPDRYASVACWLCFLLLCLLLWLFSFFFFLGSMCSTVLQVLKVLLTAVASAKFRGTRSFIVPLALFLWEHCVLEYSAF